jgi:hypothetical protein
MQSSFETQSIVRMALLCIVSFTGAAADFTGRWAGKVEGKVGLVMELRQNHDQLIGVLIAKGGGPVEFVGTIDGNNAHFDTYAIGPHTTFDFALQDNRISGTIVVKKETGSHASFTMDRITAQATPPPLEGKWAGSITGVPDLSPSGSVFFHQSGSELIGVLEIDGVEQAVTGTVSNDKVTFSGDGLTVNLTLKGGTLTGSGGHYDEPAKLQFHLSHASPRTARGVTGKWAGTFTTEQDGEIGQQPFLLTLTQDDAGVSGDFHSNIGHAKMQAVTLRGGKLSFDSEQEGREVHFELDIVNDYLMEGVANESRSGTLRTSAKVSLVKRME